jgi:hypothetical protein
MTPQLVALATLGAGFGLGVVLGVLLWRSCRNSTARWSDLVIDADTGRTSHTKVWVHVANAAMTVLFVRIGWNAAAGEGVSTLFFVYGGIVAGSQVASRILAGRSGAGEPAPTPRTTVTKTERTEAVKTLTAAAAAAPTPDATINPGGPHAKA